MIDFRRVLLTLLLGTVVAGNLCGCASKKVASAVTGCEYTSKPLPLEGATLFEEPPVVRSADGTLSDSLDVRYAYNEVAGCRVFLRSYNGRLTSETWRVKPGDTLRIDVKNDLPPFVSRSGVMAEHMMHTDFNSTNLHTHGLHVSPSGNSDNPFIDIHPGQAFSYAVHIPKNHPPGTFWYHAHLHGSTAVQLASGMAGAIIIEGGLDDVPEIRAARERIFVFQQPSYDQSGRIENFGKIFGPGAWVKSHRFTTINGQLVPTIIMRPGEVERWRLIHAGTRENIALRLAGHPLYEIATDGIALGRMVPWRAPIVLGPGYRSDVLVQADHLPPGVPSEHFDLIDDGLPAGQSLQGQQDAVTISMRSFGRTSIHRAITTYPPKPSQMLAHIVVEGADTTMQLPKPSELVQLAPYRDITDKELTGTPQHITFNVGFGACDHDGTCKPGCIFPLPGCTIAYTINGREFGGPYTRVLRLGQAAEWKLTSMIAIHPFHIHVDPFEAWRIEPDGKRHAYWKDTLLVYARKPQTIRMRYTDFTGKAVLHCHILDHEDQGMMERIVFTK